MKKHEIISKSGEFFKSCFHEAMDRHYAEENADAIANQKVDDVYKTIVILLELKTSETEIMRLISKHFGVDSINDVTEMITYAKVSDKTNVLRDYLEETGMTRVEVARYLREHEVRKALTQDAKLICMSAEKLKAYFDKQ